MFIQHSGKLDSSDEVSTSGSINLHQKSSDISFNSSYICNGF